MVLSSVSANQDLWAMDCVAKELRVPVMASCVMRMLNVYSPWMVHRTVNALKVGLVTGRHAQMLMNVNPSRICAIHYELIALTPWDLTTVVANQATKEMASVVYLMVPVMVFNVMLTPLALKLLLSNVDRVCAKTVGKATEHTAKT